MQCWSGAYYWHFKGVAFIFVWLPLRWGWRCLRCLSQIANQHSISYPTRLHEECTESHISQNIF